VIDMPMVVSIVLYFLLAAGIFGLLYLLIWLVALLFDPPIQGIIRRYGLIGLAILAVLVVIFLLLSFITGQPLIQQQHHKVVQLIVETITRQV
jgi:hypothetical protein